MYCMFKSFRCGFVSLYHWLLSLSPFTTFVALPKLHTLLKKETVKGNWLGIPSVLTFGVLCWIKVHTFHTNSFVLKIPMKQYSNSGAYLPLKSYPFYLIGATWSIAAFVLINAYNCTLISHLTLPNQKLLINSIYDLRNRPDVYLITDKYLNINAVLSVKQSLPFFLLHNCLIFLDLQTAESGFLKFLGDKLRSYSQSRCITTKDCIELVKTGSHVYTSVSLSFISFK